LLKASIRANSWQFAIIGVYFVGASIAAHVYGFSISFQIYDYAFFLFGSAIVVFSFSATALRFVIRNKPERPLYASARHIAESWNLRERALIGLPVTLILPAFFSVFTSVKYAIPTMRPFYADPMLIRWDRGLFGTDPWRLFDRLLHWPLGLLAINFVYNLWFIIMMSALFAAVFMTSRHALRRRYISTFLLTWIVLGNIVATAFSSVGPCFLSREYGLHTFRPLMDLLVQANKIVPIWALDAQGYLTQASDRAFIGAGLSAFPSLHVAVATLNCLFAFAIDNRLGYLGAIFLAIILIGSVVLGWHYAVDGLASLATVSLIWFLPNTAAIARIGSM